MSSERREQGGSDQIRERIIQLGNDLWNGNRSRMAADLEQSQSSITRVMTRQQAPSGRLIENLAKNPLVNLDWLFRGVGEPSERPESIAMPVFTRLLPGSPASEKLRPGDWRSLSTRHYRPSRYWLRVQGDEPIASSEHNVSPGDLVLMETDRNAFLDPDQITQQICGVKFDRKALKLAMVDSYAAAPDTGPSRIEADPFDLEPKQDELVHQYVIQHRKGRKPTVTVHEMVVSESGKARQTTLEDIEPRLPHIKYDQIICMCVLILRQPSAFWRD